MNRETWLNEMAQRMAPRFEELGFKLPPFRVAVGFTSAGKSKKVGGECWHSSKSEDRRFEILISPIQAESVKVACTLAHELTHAAVGFKHKHKGDFAKVMKALGAQGPMTATVPGPAFEEWVAPFVAELGPLPHARLTWGEQRSPVPGEGGEEGDGEDEGGSSNARPKQSTRMLKACCKWSKLAGVNGEQEECGYTVRLTKKWAESMGAMCPAHGPMDVEGLEVDQDGGDDE